MDINHRAPVSACAEIMVEVPIDQVWETLTDFENWPRWNKEVRSVKLQGPVAPGTEFHWKAGGSQIHSRLEEVAPLRRVVWTGRTFGLRAVHVWEFQNEGDNTRVLTSESLEGTLAHLLPGTLNRQLAKALSQGLLALKLSCERSTDAAHAA